MLLRTASTSAIFSSSWRFEHILRGLDGPSETATPSFHGKGWSSDLAN
jgi:hypothetical protein